MEYRVLLRPQWTAFNNSPEKRWNVQRKLFGIIWIKTKDTWHSRKDAEQWIADTRKIY